ncbi:hypothetical protein TorRG33x02_209730 [Trema orientale]|uniref:Uncharacterized protein n=1 Tax=Trema orientale TaxID=63057 RepID=A0A2P5ECI8_TREOI|nr:hypothetical protein TorRG33x02_209730 [Trema orientale]
MASTDPLLLLFCLHSVIASPPKTYPSPVIAATTPSSMLMLQPPPQQAASTPVLSSLIGFVYTLPRARHD